MLNIFFARGLNERLQDKSIIVNSVNPGYCYSSLRQTLSGVMAWVDWVMERALARTSEEGSRQLIWACLGGKDNIDELRGAYVSGMHVQEPSDYVISEEGQHAQTKLWVNNFYLTLYCISNSHTRTLLSTSWRKVIHQYGRLLNNISRRPHNNEPNTWLQEGSRHPSVTEGKAKNGR